MNEKLVSDFLTSRDGNKKLQAFCFLEKNGNITHLRPLLQSFHTLTDPYIKTKAIQAFSTIIRRNLLENYSKINSDMRQKFAQILKVVDPTIIESIAEGFQSEDNNKRFQAIRVLGLMGQNPHIKDLLVSMLNDENKKVRATTVSLLRQMINKTDFTLISALLDDKDERVVANCIEAIEAINQEELTPLLTQFKSHSNNRIRGNAIKALWKMSQVDVYNDINLMINNQENHLMRASACWVIGECAKYSDTKYLELLMTCNKDSHQLVKDNAISAQLKISGNNLNYCETQMNKQIKKNKENKS